MELWQKNPKTHNINSLGKIFDKPPNRTLKI